MLPFSNPDLYWHLSAGARLLAEGRVPKAEWLSWTLAGARWVDFEWLAQLVWLGLFRAGGWWALLGLKAALLSTAGLALWKTLELHGLAASARAPWLLAWALAILPANDLRPENFSVALFGLEWWWLERERLRPARRPGFREPLAALAAFALWANLHAGFAYGLALLAAAAVVAEPGRRARLFRLLAVAGLGTCLNPAGPGLYGVLLEHARGLSELAALIKEWRPPGLRDPWLWPFWGVFFVAFGAILKRQTELRLPRLHLVAVLLFGVSAARHVRTAPYFAAAAIPAAAAALAGRSPAVPAFAGATGVAGLAGRSLARAAGYGGAGALLLYWGARVAPELQARAHAPRYAPESAAAFLEANAGLLAPLRLFHPVEWGGFLGWRLGGAFPIFADGRYLFHPAMREAALARESPETFAEFLKGRGIELLLLKRDRSRVDMEARTNDGKRLALSRPAWLFYAPKADWALVHWDEQALVLVRRGKVPPAWLSAREYTLWRPDDLEAAHLQIREGYGSAATLAAERARLEARPR